MATQHLGQVRIKTPDTITGAMRARAYGAKCKQLAYGVTCLVACLGIFLGIFLGFFALGVQQASAQQEAFARGGKPFYFSAGVNPIALLGIDLLVPQTTAFEGEFGYNINEIFRVRAHFGNRNVSHGVSDDARFLGEGKFNGKQFEAGLYFDWYPAKRGQVDDEASIVRNLLYGLRLSAGSLVLINDFSLSYTHPAGRLRVGDGFTDEGTTTTVTASARYKWPVMPYLGIGYDFPVYTSDSFFIGSRFDAGFLFGAGIELTKLEASSANAGGDSAPIATEDGVSKEFDKVNEAISSDYYAIFSMFLGLNMGLRF